MMQQFVSGSQSRGHRTLVACLAVFVVALSVGCASPRKVNEEMLVFMKSGDHLGAVALLEENHDSAYGEKNEFLYLLERGMELHYAGEYAESNVSFHQATRLSDELYTTSISSEGLSFMVNDNVRPYYGQNFERALVHVFSALNYQELGEPDSALVEIRQLNSLLRKLTIDSVDATYDDDAFAHYLAGIFFEERGELDEAFVAYKKALDAYASYAEKYALRTPPMVGHDAAALAKRLGRWAVDELAKNYGAFEAAEAPEGSGQVMVFHYNGQAPEKIDVFIDIAFGEGWVYVNQIKAEDEGSEDVAKASGLMSAIAGTESVRVAFPEYRRIPKQIRWMGVRADGEGEEVRAMMVENVAAIAEKDLADHIAKIRARAIARAVVKFAINKAAEQAVKQAGGSYGDLASLVVKVGGAVLRSATEVADKRAWFTVPEEIWISRLMLTAGAHTLEINYYDINGSVLRSEYRDVTVKQGARTIVMTRTMD